LRIVAALSLSLLLGIGWIYANAQSWFWIDKHARKLGGMIMPWSYVINAARYQTEKMMQSRTLEKLPPAHFVAQVKTVIVLVIGESARAANFSLYGYARQTDPLLIKAGAIAIPNAHSCATYTTASIQCMLAHIDTSSTLIHNYEALPSYLQSNGVDVIWISNNWGEPPLKVGTYLKASEVRGDCKDSGCQLDEGMLTGLAERIAKTPNDKVFIVLHQSGSHGPDYYNHYPPDAEKFTPACRSVQVQDCSSEELVNAYDNTIVYTDRFLSKTITVLRSLPTKSTMMMYASDHGESLGEHGLYLHGTPYSLAPDVQKVIPYIVWMSPAFKQHKTLAAEAALGQAQHAHETIFHSIMGAFDMRSDIYKPQLDIFADVPSSKKQK
jgi:lipid A ethanolaminephosphotransferase